MSRAARVGYRVLMRGRTLGEDHAADIRWLLRVLDVLDQVRQLIRDDLGRAARDLHSPTMSHARIGEQVGLSRRQVQDHIEHGHRLRLLGCDTPGRCTCRVQPAA